MEELKGYFPNTNGVEMIRNLPKTNTPIMKDIWNLKILHLSRIPIVATIDWIWTNDLTKLIPQNCKKKLFIDVRIIIQRSFFLINTKNKCDCNEGPHLLINKIQKMLWKARNYMIHGLKSSPFKQNNYNTEVQFHIKIKEPIQTTHLKSMFHHKSRIKLTSTKSALRTKFPLNRVAMLQL